MMEASTPLQKSGNLRRLTLLKNAVELSPLRKSNAVSSPITSILEHSNDDDLERSRRRSNVEIQKRLSNISQEEVNFTNSYIKEQFVLCTHLYAENKITSKNAWKVQIINMLKPLCKQLGEDNLQAIGTSIDISAKVYGLRVDDMYTDGLKLANTLARNAYSGQNNGDDEGDLENQIEKECVPKKSKRKRVNVDGKKNTVSKNLQSLVGTLIKLEPVDFLSRVKPETGTIDNLFTNVLKEDNIGSTFLLINEKNTNSCDKMVINNHGKETILEALPQLKEATLHINVPFKQFTIDDWDPDQEEHHFSVEKSQLNEVITDRNGFPIPELDGSIQDIFADDNHLDDEVLIHEEIVYQLRGDLPKIVDFQPSKDTVQLSEYSYNTIVNMRTGKCIDQIWAGPSHWKLKFLRNRRTLFSGQIPLQRESNKMKKKDQPMISYEHDVAIDTSEQYVTKKKNTIFDEDKITLPLQDQFCVNFLKNLNELMLKPGVFRETQNKNSDPSDYQISAYNYENQNDSFYCTQKNNQNENVGEEGDCGGADNDENDSSLEENPLGDLVDAPETVTNQYIAYSKKAKQIDMKELKYAVWKVLTRSSIDTNAKVHHISFSDMFRKIPALLSKKENEELSCPLVFVALLHIANEQNLHLIQMEGFKDFNIECAK